MTTYTAISGQSILDICLNTYGSLDFLHRLMADNGVEGIDYDVLSGQQFVWDESLVTDQIVNLAFAASGVIYSTDVSALGSVFSVITGGGGTGGGGGGGPIITGQKKYQVVYSTSYTSNADGTTSMTIIGEDGTPIIGYDILQIELETKPLTKADFSWNKNTAVLGLLNDLTLDKDASVFVLYTKIVTT